MKTFASAIFLTLAASDTARAFESYGNRGASVEEVEDMPLFGALEKFVEAVKKGDEDEGEQQDNEGKRANEEKRNNVVFQGKSGKEGGGEEKKDKAKDKSKKKDKSKDSKSKDDKKSKKDSKSNKDSKSKDDKKSKKDSKSKDDKDSKSKDDKKSKKDDKDSKSKFSSSSSSKSSSSSSSSSSSGRSGRNRRSSRSGKSLCADRNSFFDEDMCDCDMDDGDTDICKVLWDEVCAPNATPSSNTLEFCECIGINQCPPTIEEEVVDVVQMNLRGNVAAE